MTALEKLAIWSISEGLFTSGPDKMMSKIDNLPADFSPADKKELKLHVIGEIDKKSQELKAKI
ncbi:MAG: hypothetical protein QG654_453 [Patescibacteria group bacterium]|nr:hypothetical protein [Patescibacteria group bacterium]